MPLSIKSSDFTVFNAEFVEKSICANSFKIGQSVRELLTNEKSQVPDVMFKHQYFLNFALLTDQIFLIQLFYNHTAVVTISNLLT